MSRPRVITGTDEHGRPKTEWADAKPDTDRGYGHMEPAFVPTVERRKATPAELAAARAREDEPRHLALRSGWDSTPAVMPGAPNDPERMQASRQRGAERHVEVIAARTAATYRPMPERSPAIQEEAVSQEPAHIVSSESPPPDFDLDADTEPRADTLAVLADAVGNAAEAWAEAKRTDHEADMARIRWRQARAALDAAYRALDNPPPAVAPDVDPDHEAAKANLIRALQDAAAAAELRATEDASPATAPQLVEPPAIGGGPEKRQVGPGKLTVRQAAILAATTAHKGDRKAAAKDAATSVSVVEQTLEYIGKKGLLPIELIPLLPARFAKYSGV